MSAEFIAACPTHARESGDQIQSAIYLVILDLQFFIVRKRKGPEMEPCGLQDQTNDPDPSHTKLPTPLSKKTTKLKHTVTVYKIGQVKVQLSDGNVYVIRVHTQARMSALCRFF